MSGALRFAYLGSGSKGNAALVAQDETLIMLDCGLTLPEVERRMQAFGATPRQLTAVVVTHEHADHTSGVTRLADEYALPVWMTRGTHAVWQGRKPAEVRFIGPHAPFRIGALTLTPYPVPHDAREPCQYVFSNDGGRRLGVLSDAGRVTPYMQQTLSGCNGLLLEFNHDTRMLSEGPYTARLKKRVGGPYGHLSNDQAAALLASLDRSALQRLVIAHISQVNNTPALARAAAAQALGHDPDWLEVAHQDDGLAWRELA